MGELASPWGTTAEKVREPEAKHSSIYTRTGDTGTSMLFNGAVMPKDAAYFHALGDVDELNSSIGAALAFCDSGHASELRQQLAVVQSRLLDVGSVVATPVQSSPAEKLRRVQFDGASVTQLERWIDELDARLPPLRNFILPSGGHAGALLHLARTVCRRAERSVVPLVASGSIDDQVGVYLNRLSDYLFVAARSVNAWEGKEETVYKKGAGTADIPSHAL